MYKTDGNLQSAFAGECQAYCRYILYASKAEQEGYPEVGSLFRAAAAAEMVHLRNHYTVMDAVGATRDNLLAAATSEHREITGFYPSMVEKAMEEKAERARLSFTYALEAERVHNSLFEEALQNFKAGQKMEERKYYVCQSCGNLVTGEPPQKCAICGHGAESFKQVG
ncbi:MAG: rubrerythrin family protein [Dehalococcoidales bacterium]|nr:rubrerythrin family protein [Dehalococcoidales bacterium]